jgi:small subunit ribosomal protein S6
MKHYEVTFIVDPVLSGDEIKETEQVYETMLKDEGYNIVNVDEMGLKQLAYPINKRSSGIYYCIEFSGETGKIVNNLELALRRDERVMRFLTISLDKYGVKYNDDKRNGLIGKVQKKAKKDNKGNTPAKPAPSKPAPRAEKPAPAAEVPAPVKASSEEE